MRTETKTTGTYQRPAPKDIAYMVKELRGYFGWKQLALADEAGITERTIERIEAGTTVSDDTLRKVAKALKLREGAFTEAGYCPSEAELIAEVKKIQDRHTVTELRDLSEARDLENVMGQHAHLIDGSAIEDDLAEGVACLRDSIGRTSISERILLTRFCHISNGPPALLCDHSKSSDTRVLNHVLMVRAARFNIRGLGDTNSLRETGGD